MLAPAQVVVFLAEPDALLAMVDHARVHCVLDALDHTHVARHRFAPDRSTATASRLLQRLAVGWAADVDPATLRFERSSTGRPLVASPGAAREICFSTSNTRQMVGCAVALQRQIGFDLEAVRDDTPAELFDHCLDAGERRSLEALPLEIRGERFIALWTLKEAYLKALGIGVTVALDQIAFEPGVGVHGPLLRHDRAAGGDPGHWVFHTMRPLASHLASVAIPSGHRLTAWWASCAPHSAALRLERRAA